MDSEQLRWGRDEEPRSNTPSQAVEQTIEEDKLAEAEDDRPDARPTTPRHAKRNSYQRLSRLSDEARLSIATITPSSEKKGTDSNRSSTTIKGIQVNGTNSLANSFNEVDFERALRKFAAERDSFLNDLTLSAGAVITSQPKIRPKTQRIVNEDSQGLKSGVGSIRRRISFRDMGSSIKRQPSVARQRRSSLICCINSLSFREVCVFRQ